MTATGPTTTAGPAHSAVAKQKRAWLVARDDYRFARDWCGGALFTPTLRPSSSVLLRSQGFHPEVQDEL